VHYGISLQWGPNILMYNTKDFSSPPTSWSIIYDPKYKGKITIPDNPIQIADAALYLSKTNPSLGMTDPYELTQPQFQAAVALLKQQRPLIRKYWGLASQEVSVFTTGEAVLGAAWPYQESQLTGAKASVASVIRQERATGHLRQREDGLRAELPVAAGVDDGGHGIEIRAGTGVRLSAALWRRSWVRGAALLTPPLAWFLLIYVASLAVLLLTAFWRINS